MTKLGIRPDEGALVGWTATLFAVTQASHGFGANAADALFFLRFGVEELPRMILLSGLLVMVLLVVHALGVAAKGVDRWLWVAMALTAGWVVAEWLGVRTDWRAIYPVVWISTQGIIMVTFTAVWNSASAACTTRQAKRLFPLFATAGVGGGILGNLLTGPAATTLGTENLLLVQAGLLIAGAVLFLRVRRFYRSDDGDDSAAGGPALRAALGAVRSTRLLKLAAAAGFLLSMLWFLVVFPFNEAVAAEFDSEASLASFLGVFSSISTAATFLVSLLVTNRLFSRFGIVASLLTAPAVYVIGFSTWLWAFGFASAVALRAAQWVAVSAISFTAYTALFNVLTGRARAQVMTFMIAVPRQLGVVAAGFLLVVGDSLSASVQYSLGLAIAVIAMTFVIAMRRAYLDAVIAAVRRGLTGMFDVAHAGLRSPVDGDARRVLETHLRDERPEARALAVAAMARTDADADSIEGLMSDENSRVRMAAFDSLCVVDADRIVNHVSTALSDESPAVRLRALRFLAHQRPDDTAQLATTAIGDPDPAVRVAAAALVGEAEARRQAQALLEAGQTDGLVAVLEEVAFSGAALGVSAAPYLSHPERRVRRAAVQAHGRLGGEPDLLLPGLDDPSLWVRSDVAEILSASAAGRRLLREVMSTGSVHATDAALSAMVPWDETDEVLLTWAEAEANRAVHLSEMAAALERGAGTSTAPFLIRTLSGRSRRHVRWVLLAMTTADNQDVMAVVARGIRAGDAETRGRALEALETIGDRRVHRVLLPLLEEEAAGGQASDARGALRDLADDFDPWLRALAVRCLAEEITLDLDRLHASSESDESHLVRQAVPTFTIVQPESAGELDAMGRVLALQSVAMFEELDPEELELIASVTTERHFDSGDAVIAFGDEGDEMLVIVDGEAVVTVPNGGSDPIRRLGPGDHVGELAPLAGGRRAANVTAGPSGLHCLVVSKGDLIAVLEERPSVALGMLATLARRLAASD